MPFAFNTHAIITQAHMDGLAGWGYLLCYRNKSQININKQTESGEMPK